MVSGIGLEHELDGSLRLLTLGERLAHAMKVKVRFLVISLGDAAAGHGKIWVVLRSCDDIC